ncbi:MAG TPA: hypothetical protein DEB23_05625 [Chitinophagaceae bacterium]|nr:hypothetical protein [Chitinophagaceae bacterium]
MEVHHPHHPSHKKKWSEYIIEFVMLFTAVTLGFFAENIREHLAENEKKKELMKIVSLDLQRDLKQLEFHKNDAELKLVTCDSIFPVLKMNPKVVNLKMYYRLLLNHLAYWDFNANDKSRNEADAKGYFRNEEDAELAYYISKVDFFILDYKTIDEESVRLRTNLKEIAEDMTEHAYYNACISLRADLLPKTFGIKPPDPKAVKKAAYLISNFKLLYTGYLGDIDSLNKYGNKAIELINKKYN